MTAVSGTSVSESVADVLRSRILSGELPDQAELPRQEDLLAEFGISRPSLREALRILEAEGLVSVRRGSIGGSVVHVPRSVNVAYMLSLVLDHQQVPLMDVGQALLELEPVCAALAASRPDRERAVIAPLRRIHTEFVAAADDLVTFTEAGRRFHQELVAGCGNRSLVVVVGALSELWSTQERAWARRASERGLAGEDERAEGIRAHEHIIELLEAGDGTAVHALVRRHLRSSQRYALTDPPRELSREVVRVIGHHPTRPVPRRNW